MVAGLERRGVGVRQMADQPTDGRNTPHVVSGSVVTLPPHRSVPPQRVLRGHLPPASGHLPAELAQPVESDREFVAVGVAERRDDPLAVRGDVEAVE